MGTEKLGKIWSDKILVINPKIFATFPQFFFFFDSCFRLHFNQRCCKIRFKVGEIRINVNPISTLLGACAFWFVIGWALADSETSIEHFDVAKQWVTDKCTW